MRFLNILYVNVLLMGILFSTANAIEFTKEPTIKKNPNPKVPLAAVVHFSADRPVETKIQVSDGEHTWTLNYDISRKPSEGLPVIGMRPGTAHSLRVTIADPNNGESKTAEVLHYTTPPLPEDALAFPQIKVLTADKVRMEPGLTIFNPRRRIPPNRVSAEQRRKMNQQFGMLTAVDADGHVVWYYNGDSRISDFKLLSNGHILFLTQDYSAVEIDRLGNTVREWYAKHRPQGKKDGAIAVDALTFHHAIEELPNGNFLVLSTERRKIKNYYTSAYDKDAPRQEQWVMGDVILEFEPSGKVVWRWNAFEHLDPFHIGYETFRGYWKRRGFPDTIDWSHANNLDPHVEDNFLLINFRYLSAVLKIERPSGAIQWIAGGKPSKWGELSEKCLFLKNDRRWFWHQHAAHITKNNTLLLFDNGNYQAEPFEEPVPRAQTRSRVMEYKIDEENQALRAVWSSEHSNEEPVVSFAMGSAQLLPTTGNILAGYGFVLHEDDLDKEILSARTWTLIREFTHTKPAQVVWELTLKNRDPDSPVSWTLYGAKRIQALP